MKIMSILKKGIVLGLASLTFVSVEGMAPSSYQLIDHSWVTLNNPCLPKYLEAHRTELCNAYRGMVNDFNEISRNSRDLGAADKGEIVALQNRCVDLYNSLFVRDFIGGDEEVVRILQNELPALCGKLNNLYREKMGLPVGGGGIAGGPQN